MPETNSALLVALYKNSGMNFRVEVIHPYRYFLIYNLYNTPYFLSSILFTRSNIDYKERNAIIFHARGIIAFFIFRLLASKWIISLILSLPVKAIVIALQNLLQSAANWTLASEKRRKASGEPDCRPFPWLVARLIVQKRINRQARLGKWWAQIWVETSGVKSLRAISKRSSAALCPDRTHIQLTTSRNGINTSVPQLFRYSLYGFLSLRPLYFSLTDREWKNGDIIFPIFLHVAK